MAEKIVYDIEMKGLESAKRGLEEITKIQIQQQDAIKQTQSNIRDYEIALRNLQKEVSKNGTATEEQIAQEQLLTSAIESSKIQLSSQKDELANTNKERRAAVDVMNTHNTAINAEIGSNEQLKAQLKLMTAEYNKMSQEERDNTEAGKELTSEILNITNKLKENEKAVGDNRRNVGNYEAAITSALGKVNIMGVNLGQLTQSIKAGVQQGMTLVNSMKAQAEASQAAALATTAQGAATTGTTVATGGLSKAMNILKVALISTGIGAIVIALGALVAAFLSTQRGADALNRIITPIKFVFQGLWGVLQDLSFALVDNVKSIGSLENAWGKVVQFFKDQINVRIQSTIDLFGLLGSAVKKVFSGDFTGALDDAKNAAKEFVDVGTGVDNAVDKLGNVVDAAGEAFDALQDKIKKSYEEGKRFAEMEIALEKAQIKMVVAIAQTNKALQLNKLIAADQLETDEARIKALEESIDLSNQKAAQEKSLLQAQLDLAVLKTQQNDTDRAAYQEIANIQAQMIDLEAAAFGEQKRMYSQLSGFLKEIKDKEEARLLQIQELILSEEERATKERDNKLAELGLNKEVTQLTEQELAAREAVYALYYENLGKQQEDLIKEQLELQKKYYSSENYELERNYYEQLTLLGANEEAKKLLTDQYNKDRLNSTKQFLESQMQIISSELEQLTASKEEEGLAKSLLSEKQKEELKLRLQEIQAELAKVNYEYGNIGTDPNTGERVPLISEEMLQTTNAHLGEVGNMVSSISNIIASSTQKQMNDLQTQLDRGLLSQEEFNAKKYEIEKKAFEKQKKAQIVQTLIAGSQAAIQSLANTTLPFPLSLAAPLLIGAETIAKVAAIKSQKFEDGGLIQGAPHSRGGVPFTVQGRGGFEAEGGEFIQNKKAVQHYGTDFMQAVNTMKIPKLFAEGGFVAPVASGSMSSQVRQGVGTLAESITSQENRVILVESDLRKTQNKVNNVEAARTY